MPARRIDGAENEVDLMLRLVELAVGGLQTLPENLEVLCHNHRNLNLDAHDSALALLERAISLYAARGGSIRHAAS